MKQDGNLETTRKKGPLSDAERAEAKGGRLHDP